MCDDGRFANVLCWLRAPFLAALIAGGCGLATEGSDPSAGPISTDQIYAIGALEPVPEHAFGWVFGPPEPLCRLGPDSTTRDTGDVGRYQGADWAKVQVIDGTCRGETGWVSRQERR
jgi:hypothetical protein